MKKTLWRPVSPEKTKMEELARIINNNHSQSINSYDQLHNWSINHIPKFWEENWNYCEIIHSKSYTQIVDNTKAIPGAKWFRGSKLNFAENLLKFRDERIAIKCKTEDQGILEITYYELFQEVEKVSHSLRNLGVLVVLC